MAMRLAFTQQRQKILPLQQRCVLKFIDEKMIETGAETLVDEWHIVVGYDAPYH